MNWTANDLLNKGIRKNPDGSYSRQPKDKMEYNPSTKAIKSTVPIRAIASPKKLELTFDVLAPGLNGKDGLLRIHWSKRKKWVDAFQALIMAQTQKKIQGEVIVTYERHNTRFMDWDNMGASFKTIGDALVKCGVIEDDSPEIIVKFDPQQVKVGKTIERKTIVKIYYQ